jgi:hypothetical protein
VLFYFAKFLQALGFADVGLAIYAGLVEPAGLNKEVLFIIGVGLFWGGRLLERRSVG